MNSLHIYCQDLEKTVRFYASVLGFFETARYQVDGITQMMELTRHGLTISFHTPSSFSERIPLNEAPHGASSQPSFVPSFDVEADDALLTLVEQFGGSVVHRDARLGLLSTGSIVRDPDGRPLILEHSAEAPPLRMEA